MKESRDGEKVLKTTFLRTGRKVRTAALSGTFVSCFETALLSGWPKGGKCEIACSHCFLVFWLSFRSFVFGPTGVFLDSFFPHTATGSPSRQQGESLSGPCIYQRTTQRTFLSPFFLLLFSSSVSILFLTLFSKLFQLSPYWSPNAD